MTDNHIAYDEELEEIEAKLKELDLYWVQHFEMVVYNLSKEKTKLQK